MKQVTLSDLERSCLNEWELLRGAWNRGTLLLINGGKAMVFTEHDFITLESKLSRFID